MHGYRETFSILSIFIATLTKDEKADFPVLATFLAVAVSVRYATPSMEDEDNELSKP